MVDKRIAWAIRQKETGASFYFFTPLSSSHLLENKKNQSQSQIKYIPTNRGKKKNKNKKKIKENQSK